MTTIVEIHDASYVVEVDADDSDQLLTVEVLAESITVEMLDVGEQGPTGSVGATGAVGPLGPTGPIGPTGTASFVMIYTQMAPSDSWIITHNIVTRPDVDLYDNNGELVFADVSHPNSTTVRIDWAYQTTGVARLT